MKRGWLAVGLLAGLLALSLWHSATLSDLTGQLRDQLERAENLTEESRWEEAARLTREARTRWDESGFYLHMTMAHEAVDEITVAFAEVGEFLEHREAGEYSAANARLMELLTLLGEMEKPLPENLL